MDESVVHLPLHFWRLNSRSRRRTRERDLRLVSHHGNAMHDGMKPLVGPPADHALEGVPGEGSGEPSGKATSPKVSSSKLRGASAQKTTFLGSELAASLAHKPGASGESKGVDDV
mmetsp:Transcript_128024/g.410221  ORF Transcript_128024/g.410221 Transcript_128024/m.410221 type:complete len:115 (+) Transcript_128024:1010-1354(+)